MAAVDFLSTLRCFTLLVNVPQEPRVLLPSEVAASNTAPLLRMTLLMNPRHNSEQTMGVTRAASALVDAHQRSVHDSGS